MGYAIIEKEYLNPTVVRMVVEAPLVARRAQPGQFVMLRVGEWGERIPLTIAGFDRVLGSIEIIFQVVGATTAALAELPIGGAIDDFAGPLGVPSHLDGLKNVCVIGGGLGCAIAYPQARALKEAGVAVTMIAGFRDENLVILEKEMRSVSDEFILTLGKTLVTEPLKQMLEDGKSFDAVIAVGPLIMMKFVCLTTKPYEVKTWVSMNPLMVDGTGMCGCCRVTVGGATKFACVDGPDFDGHEVDFDEAMKRVNLYKDFEHKCFLEVGHGND
ncbi:ferredoxin-NADP+ reductase subunit alpha [Clostridia bacterium]|nr:ferredoxin-NADP+ reductase subunit alpha [Clostridia bacterium]